MKNIDYLNLKAINAPYEEEIKVALAKMIDKGWYLYGENVASFEKEWAEYCGTQFCISCGNGMDALRLTLKAWMELRKLTAGDEVVVPANTFIATILAVTDCGLRPVFAEPDARTYLLTAATVRPLLTEKTRVILPVHLYGQACAMEEIYSLAEEHNLLVLEDSAQRHCQHSSVRLPQSVSNAAAFSFYPGKNLGAMGDAGAVVTNDETLAQTIKRLANYGSTKKYVHENRGINSRMDEFQAAILRIKLRDLERCNQRRLEIATRYLNEIRNPQILLPYIESNSTFHIFAIRSVRRDALQSFLSQQGIATQIHYPTPPHKQLAYKELEALSLPLTEEISQTELSLPCNQAMTDEEVSRVIAAANAFLA